MLETPTIFTWLTDEVLAVPIMYLQYGNMLVPKPSFKNEEEFDAFVNMQQCRWKVGDKND